MTAALHGNKKREYEMKLSPDSKQKIASLLYRLNLRVNDPDHPELYRDPLTPRFDLIFAHELIQRMYDENFQEPAPQEAPAQHYLPFPTGIAPAWRDHGSPDQIAGG